MVVKNQALRKKPRWTWWPLAAITLAGLALRLLTVSWHAPYPLSGDEVGFFEQARTFVQGQGFHDLPFMRAPLYPLFLAVIFRLFGAEIAAARVAQALLSTATIPLLYLWAQRRHGPRAGLLAAALGAALFSFSVQTAFLLTETLFLFLLALGMVLLEWGEDHPAWWIPLGCGVLFGLVTLTRSIGLPLVVVAAVGLGLSGGRGESRRHLARLKPALLVLAGAVLVIVPWTVRNAVVHHSLILVDTTGTTNLWMDNDPELGRDAVKAELLKYSEGERQGLSLEEGMRSIVTHPGWFAEKCWRELRRFFSLEYFDDFIRRPAIWYPEAEVWSRVLLGDGLYLVVAAAGLIGLISSRTRSKALDLFWLAYVPATTTLFHVELRYRLPFLLAIIPYAAAALAQPRESWAALTKKPWRAVGAGLAMLALGGILLSWADYPGRSVQIVRKRVHVAQGRRALDGGRTASAEAHARRAIDIYPESSEARVLLAHALRAAGHSEEAEAVLRQAIDYRSGNPHPHLLLGDLLRSQGRLEEAASELAYESHSLEDLQRWAWERFPGTPPETLDLGSGLELGHVLGWHLPERTAEGTSFRWSDDRVEFRLAAPQGGGPARLLLRLSAGRPADLPLPAVELWLGGERLGGFTVENGWHTCTVEIGDPPPGTDLLFELRAPTYRPHRYDRHLPDDRRLGVMVDWVQLTR